MKTRYRPLAILLLAALSSPTQAQPYEEYREVWQDLRRARFATYRYDLQNVEASKAAHVSDRPLEWSNNLGASGENTLVDPFDYSTSGVSTAKHVLIMVHGYGPGGIFGGGYEDRAGDFDTRFIQHETGSSAWFQDDTGPSLYPYLRGEAGAAGFDPDEWVILAVTMDLTQGSGLSILQNQRRLRALMDLLWYHKKEQIRTLSFVSHSTGGPIVKGVLSGSDPAQHPWVRYVDDHISLAGALGGTAFVYLDVPASLGAPALRHQLMYGIQHPDDFTANYTYFAGRTGGNSTFKRSDRWPAHVNVLSVAGVWGGSFDGNPWSGGRVGLIPWNLSDPLDLRLLNVYEGKTDGVVPNMGVLEAVQYKQLDPLLGAPFEWQYQIAEANRYGVDHNSTWTLPDLGSPGTPLVTGGAGALPLGASSNADNIPGADRFRGQKVTYVEVEAQHNGMLHNEHLLRAIRKRLGVRTVAPNVTRPRVTGLSQSSGPLAGGNTIQIHGTGFRYVTRILFGEVAVSEPRAVGTPPSWTVDSDTQITVEVPEAVPRLEEDTSPYIVDVTVTNPAGVSPTGTTLNDYRYLPAAQVPSITPEGGTFNTPPLVTLATTTPGATLYYTLNGSDPHPGNNAAHVYTVPITIPAPLTGDFTPYTLRARAVRDGYLDSPVALAVFTVEARVATPTAFPNGGDFTGFVNVTLGAATPGAAIYYTTDGSEPTYNSTFYTGQFRLEVGDHLVKARAYRIGYNESASSSTAFRVYALSTTRAADPILIPRGSGQFADALTVRMTNDTEGAQIRYTIGKNEAPPTPTETSPVYTAPFVLTFDQADVPQGGTAWFIRAKTFKAGLPPSNVVQRNYTIAPGLAVTAAPTFTPAGGTFNNAITVTVASATPFARIYLTTDGTPAVYDPDLQSRASPSSLNLNRNTTVRALATRPFFSTSEEASTQFVFQSASPEITAAPTTGLLAGAENGADVYVDSVQVSLGTATNGAVIRYTLDGAEPGEDAAPYTAPFYLREATTVTARAFKTGYLHSDVVARSFVVARAEAPIVTRHPEEQEAEVGATVVFVVRATGMPAPAIQWQHQGNDIDGATSDSLVLQNVRISEGGLYRALARNAAGTDTSTAAPLIVLPAVIPPVILTQPDSRHVPVGSVVTFSVVASGKPTPSYRWLKDGRPIVAGDTSAFTLSSARLSDAGRYSVEVRNRAGVDTSRVATLSVSPAQAPRFSLHPASITVAEGDTVRFAVRATADPEPLYRWLHEGQVIPGAVDTVLVLPNVRPTDAGAYTAISFNLAGIDTSRVAVLRVGTGTSVEEMDGIPTQFELRQNYPNPFQSTTTIRYGLPEPARVTIEVFDLLGRRVASLTEDAPTGPGWHALHFDGSGWASGVYFVRLRADGKGAPFTEARTAVLMK